MPLETMKTNDHTGSIAPIPYYGGKHRLSRHIVPIVCSVPHGVYCEPYSGGLSVLFSKPDEPNKIEVINDINIELNCLYRAWKLYPKTLLKSINSIPYSEFVHREFRKASVPYNAIDCDKDELIRVATSIYYRCSIGFGFQFNKSYKYDKHGKVNYPELWKKRKIKLSRYMSRLESCYIEYSDGIDCIKKWDSKKALFFIDPPYPNTYLGPYGKYSHIDLDRLSSCLQGIQGSYILCTYDNFPVLPSSNYVLKFEVTRNNKTTKKVNEMIQIKIPDNVTLPDIESTNATITRLLHDQRT